MCPLPVAVLLQEVLRDARRNKMLKIHSLDQRVPHHSTQNTGILKLWSDATRVVEFIDIKPCKLALTVQSCILHCLHCLDWSFYSLNTGINNGFICAMYTIAHLQWQKKVESQ